MTVAQELIEEICKGEIDTEGVFLTLDNMCTAEMREFMDEIKKLVHHKDTTVGLWATDIDPIILFNSDEKEMFQITY